MIQSTHAVGALGFSFIILCATSYAQNDTVCFPVQQFSRTDFYAVGQSPGQVELEDLDRDGDLDAVVLNRDDGTFTVFQGKPDGSFAYQATHQSGENPIELEYVDLDQDRDVDLLVVDSGTQEIVVYLNNGDAYFTEHSRVQVGPDSYSVRAADFNKDGYIDLVYTSSHFLVDVPTVELYLGGPGITFDEPVALVDDIRAFVLSIADLNQDGDDDFVVLARGSSSGNQGRVYLGRGDATFHEPIHFDAVDSSFTSMVEDMNNDGHLDVVAAGGDGVVIYFGDGSGEIASSSGNIAFVLGAFYVESAHLNNDGLPDLVVAHTGLISGGGVALIESNAARMSYDTRHLLSPESASWVAVADLNNDGRNDIVASEDQAGAMVVLLDQCELCPADLNGDRVLDALDVGILLRPRQSANIRLDYNLDGEFNFYDISAFLRDYALGCQ